MRKFRTLAMGVLVLAGLACVAQMPRTLPDLRAGRPITPGTAAAPPSSAGSAEEKAQSKPDAAAPRFRDIGTAAGLTTVPNTSIIRRYIVEEMGGGGVALFDCDNDGKLDIAVVNDSTIEQNLRGGDPMVTLYHQDGDSSNIHFTDITEPAGLTVRGWGMGIAIGDFDNDGLPDMYVTGFGHNVLYRNRGGCKFEDVTEKAGLKVGGFSTGAAWADYDRDGRLDLFVARYVVSDLRNLPKANPRATGLRSVLIEIPDVMDGESDFLFRNRGDGTFEDVSKQAGLSDPQKGRGMGVVWGDYDNDGWPDLYVTNDAGADYLYHNKKDGIFEEVGFMSGSAVGESGEIFGNMAADFADYDRDGKLDLFVTRYGDQPPSLYHNEDFRYFTDATTRARLFACTVTPVKWGTGFGDFDNDGWPDLMIANGSFSSQVDILNLPAKFREPMLLFRNLRDGTFADVSDASGLNNGPLHSRRGTAFGDINNDGNVDAVVFNVNAPPSLFINETRNKNHRVLFRLIGNKSNRAAIGARVTVRTSSLTQIDEVRGGGSYLSTNDTRLHFGLGAEAVIGRLEIAWPSGLKQEFRDVAADAIYEIEEGGEIRKALALPAPGGK